VADKPSVSPCDWISVGESGIVRAVVCTVYQDSTIGDCEVVYLDERDRAINENVRWVGTYWEFDKRGSDYGGYADNYSRLQEYVGILRAASDRKRGLRTKKNPLKSGRTWRRNSRR